MGQRGPQPTPTAILKNRGSWRGNINKDEPMPDQAPEDFIPDYLNCEEVQEWNYFYPRLYNLGVITELDIHILAMLCISWVKYKKLIREDDIKSLELERLFSQIMKLSAKLGITPSDRSNIKAAKQPNNNDKEEGNDISKFLKMG